LLAIIYDNGARQLAYPMSTGLWIVKDVTAPGLGGDFIYPFSPSVISSRFRTAERPTHDGLDFSYGGIGGAAIKCAGDGVVDNISDDPYTTTFGNFAAVNHGTIGGVNVRTIYAHMATPPLVEIGDTVVKGQNLGPVGTTGLSTGNHLHWQVELDGDPVDPEIFMADYV